MRTSLIAGPHAAATSAITSANGKTRPRVCVVMELTAFARLCTQSVRSLWKDL